MKYAVAVIVVLFCSFAFAQDQLVLHKGNGFDPAVAQPVLTEGSVLIMLAGPNPDHTLTYDWVLCCGILDGTGGFLGNGFSYYQNNFTAFWRGPGQLTGYSLTATVDATSYTVHVIDKYCSTQTFVVNSASVSRGKTVDSGLIGEYTQQSCVRNGIYSLDGGGLTLHHP